jgi:cytochrome c oxidase subunit 4
MTTKTHNEEHHHDSGEPHIVGNSVYIMVWVALMILTAITVWVARHNFGVFNIVVALGIASIKASLVALYFMHLKYEDKLTWTFAVYPLFLLALLIGLTASDVFYRVSP